MAKKISEAKSRVSSSHTGIKDAIANLRGIREENGVKAVPFDGNPLRFRRDRLLRNIMKR